MTTVIPWASRRALSARPMPSVSAFSDLSTLLSYGLGTPQSRQPPWPGSIATTIAPGFGAKTELDEPGGGTTWPGPCVGVGVAAGADDGAALPVGVGSAVLQPATAKARQQARTSPGRGVRRLSAPR